MAAPRSSRAWMRRAIILLLLSIPTVAVAGAGLGWPPPAWLLEVGPPGSLGPTGRVAAV